MNYFRGKLFCILVGLLAISPLISYGYSSQFQAEYKGGSRHIGRLNIFVPVWYRSEQLVYIDTIGMIAKKPVKEFNLGGGYRHIFEVSSLPVVGGMYLFGDIKETPNKKTAYQMTGGLELLSTLGEFRINGYLPIGKKESVLSTETDLVHDGANIYFGNKDKVEKILGGFDLEAGYKIPSIPVNTYVGFYHFSKDSVKINGGRFRLEYKPFNWLVTGGEYSYDKERKNKWYLNLAVRLNLLSFKQDEHSPFSIKGKMTQIPVRDVDIITAEREEIRSDAKLATRVATASELKQALQEGKTEIVITNNIDFGGEVIGYQYASPTKPIKNAKIAGALVVEQGGIIKQVSLHPIELSNYNVQQQAGSPVVANIGGDINLAGALFPWVEDSELFYLTLKDWDINAGSGSGLVGYGKNCSIHHINNSSNITGDTSASIIHVAEDTNLYSCTNTGNIIGEYSGGIVGAMLKNSSAYKNSSSGNVIGEGSAGIIVFMLNDSKAYKNTNSGDITGEDAVGIISTMMHNTKAYENTNSKNITGLNSGGIIGSMSGNSEAYKNINSGDITGQHAAGIIAEMQDSSKAHENTNSGSISNISSGIVDSILNNTVVLQNNANTGTVAIGGNSIVRDNTGGIDISSNTG